MTTNAIEREPGIAARTDFDIIVIGGGIYGAMLGLESAKIGLKTLILERDDYGAQTSFNSLRILHGGLRYLQNLDLNRFAESVRERRWFLRNYPELTRPLPCLMPLYGKGMLRPSILRAALGLNDMLSIRRNAAVPANRQLRGGKVVGPAETRELCGHIDEQGLKGGAIWYDACMPDSQRIIIEILRWATNLGTTALNYMEAEELLTGAGRVTGVRARSQSDDGDRYEFRAPLVINATGPWSDITAMAFGSDAQPLFHPSLAWNLLLDRSPISEFTLAVAPRRDDGQTYFLQPWKGKILAGTGHSPWHGRPDGPAPSPEQIQRFLDDLNDAVPGLELANKDILHLFSGLLPASDRSGASLAVRERIYDHAEGGGPAGLISTVGVKFTTSRLVAEKTIRHIANRYKPRVQKKPAAGAGSRPLPQVGWNVDNTVLRHTGTNETWRTDLKRIIEQESVVHLDDLIVRRTTLWECRDWTSEMLRNLTALFEWDESRREEEIKRAQSWLAMATRSHGAPPQTRFGTGVSAP